MEQSFSRQELYELVWSKPMQQLAADFEVSDVGLAKICRGADIPTPERGYWARKAAGKTTIVRPLPARFPGGTNFVSLGKGRQGIYGQDKVLLTEPLPPPPCFEEDLSAVAERVRKIVGKVSCPKNFERCHRIIATLLARDEKRRTEYVRTGYGWDAPKYESTSEKRRLRILNAIFLASQRVGGKPSMSTSQYDPNPNQASVGAVTFTLEAVAQRKEKSSKAPPMKLTIQGHWEDTSGANSWTDTEDVNLENLLDEIVVEIFVTAEIFYRKSVVSHHEWLIKRRADLEEEARRQKIEAERKARELKEKEEKERIDQLLAQAGAVHQSSIIRSYVQEILSRSAELPVEQKDLEKWTVWALAEADRIDPVKNGTIIKAIQEANPKRDE